MKKFIAIFYLGLLLAIIYGAEAYASDFTRPELRIVVDGKVLNPEIEIKDNIIYVSAREIGEALNKNIYWTSGRGLIVIENRRITMPEFYIKNNRAMVDLNYMLQNTDCTIDFYNHFNVLAINIDVKIAEQDLYRILPDYSSYSAEDLEWMAKIIHAEARGEPYDAKLAVGSVVLNRVDSYMYPNTVKEVIFDRANGIQFTPSVNGSIYNEPLHDSWMAAYEVLEGRKNAGNAMFFLNPRYAQSTWVSNNRQYAFTLENHDFYY